MGISSVKKLTHAQIGKAGELLVQYRLLLMGVESSQMTTDTGIDLVAFLPESKTALTIQVKTNLRPKPGGGKGAPALDWWVPCTTPADLVALVDLQSQQVWALKPEELAGMAQQKSGGRWHFYVYTQATSVRARKPWSTLPELETFLLQNRSL